MRAIRSEKDEGIEHFGKLKVQQAIQSHRFHILKHRQGSFEISWSRLIK